MELPFDVLVAFNTNLTEGEINARLISRLISIRLDWGGRTL
jgi:hypothetical protein